MQEIESAKQLMEQGWRAREDLNFDQAINLLNEAKSIFEKNSDWFNVTECLNHLAYTKKLQAAQYLNEGKNLLEEARAISMQHSTKDILIKRAQMSLFEAYGNFEKAFILAGELVEASQKPNVKADYMSHLASFKLRTGDINGAMSDIESAQKLMSSDAEGEKEPFRSIWLCRIFLTKALILFDLNKKDEARSLATKALELAEQNNLKTRINQAKEFLALY